jgi:hypothetical protein
MDAGEIYPEDGVESRESVIRSRVDKSNFPIAGNGTPDKLSDRRHGTDPPKNE